MQLRGIVRRPGSPQHRPGPRRRSSLATQDLPLDVVDVNGLYRDTTGVGAEAGVGRGACAARRAAAAFRGSWPPSPRSSRAATRSAPRWRGRLRQSPGAISRSVARRWLARKACQVWLKQRADPRQQEHRIERWLTTTPSLSHSAPDPLGAPRTASRGTWSRSAPVLRGCAAAPSPGRPAAGPAASAAPRPARRRPVYVPRQQPRAT
jgi:hypothetical protein